MLSVTLVTDRDGNNARSPVPHKAFSTRIEDRLAADHFCTCPIYLGYCEQVFNRVVAQRENLARLSC